MIQSVLRVITDGAESLHLRAKQYLPAGKFGEECLLASQDKPHAGAVEDPIPKLHWLHLSGHINQLTRCSRGYGKSSSDNGQQACEIK